MGKIHIIDVTNRDGVQTAKLGLSKLEKTMVNLYLNDMGSSNQNLVSPPRVMRSTIFKPILSCLKSGFCNVFD